MKLIAQLQLKTTADQSDSLLDTMKVANKACDFISDAAWRERVFGKFALQRLTYYDCRDKYPLTAQVVIRCIAKVADAYKLDKKSQRTFKPLGAIAYDHQILRYVIDKSEVSIWTTSGRLRIPFVCGDRQRELLKTRQGESDLAFIKGKWYLFAVCNIEEPKPIDMDAVLGVDLGIVEIATDSNGKRYSGATITKVRRKYKHLRNSLQSKGTKSAKRHLKKIARHERNFVRTENHRISKEIVETAHIERKALALEDLKGIRERSKRFGREMRWQMGNWAFAQLQGFIGYKARIAGVPVVFVEARNTSRTCSKCGHCEKANRKSQSHFSCRNCGCELNADFNAAINIATKGCPINQPIVATLG